MTIATNIILAIRIYALYGHDCKGESKSHLIDRASQLQSLVGVFKRMLSITSKVAQICGALIVYLAHGPKAILFEL